MSVRKHWACALTFAALVHLLAAPAAAQSPQQVVSTVRDRHPVLNTPDDFKAFILDLVSVMPPQNGAKPGLYCHDEFGGGNSGGDYVDVTTTVPLPTLDPPRASQAGSERCRDGVGTHTVSIKRLSFSDGHLYKVLSNAGPAGTNGAQFEDEGFDILRYLPVTAGAGGNTPPPPPNDLAQVLARLDVIDGHAENASLQHSDLQKVANAVRAKEDELATHAEIQALADRVEQIRKDIQEQIKALNAPGMLCRLIRIGC